MLKRLIVAVSIFAGTVAVPVGIAAAAVHHSLGHV